MDERKSWLKSEWFFNLNKWNDHLKIAFYYSWLYLFAGAYAYSHPVFNCDGLCAADKDVKRGSSSADSRDKIIRGRRRRRMRRGEEKQPRMSGNGHAERWRPARWGWWWTAALTTSCWSRWGPLWKEHPSCLSWDVRWLPWPIIFSCLQDVRKLHKQIQRCYAMNRRAAQPVQVSSHLNDR